MDLAGQEVLNVSKCCGFKGNQWVSMVLGRRGFNSQVETEIEEGIHWSPVYCAK